MARTEGLDRLKAKFRALPTAIRKEVRVSMERVAQNVVDLAVHLAPVLKAPHKGRVAGALKNSIDWGWGPPPASSIFGGGKNFQNYKEGDLKLSIYAGNELAWYARFVEFGVHKQTKGERVDNASGRRRKSKRNVFEGIPALPFFYPAWRAYRNSMKSAATTAAKKGAAAIANISGS